jgi:hypothetical protein
MGLTHEEGKPVAIDNFTCKVLNSICVRWMTACMQAGIDTAIIPSADADVEKVYEDPKEKAERYKQTQREIQEHGN